MPDVVGTGLAYWLEDTGEWDQLILGGATWPGVWEIRGDGVERDIDLKKSKGSDQATLEDNGYKNGKFDAVGIIYNDDQWRELQALLPDVHPRRKGGDRKALQIIHPQVNVLGIDSAYLTKIRIPELDKTHGGPMVITLSFIEWVPKPKKVDNASGGGAGGQCGPKWQAAKNAVDIAAAQLAVAQASYDALGPNDVDAVTALMLAQQGHAFAQADLLMTPCSSSGNSAQAEDCPPGRNCIEETTVEEANAGLWDADGETPTGAADDLGGFDVF